MLVLAWQVHPAYRLVVAANRDEFHARPAAALARWSDAAGITGGRDLRAGGTWLALHASSRFGVITNFHDAQPSPPGAPSRGELIAQFLPRTLSPEDFLRELEPGAGRYGGFNLLLSDARSLAYGSNRAAPFARALAPGVYGLSNELLDTPSPKLARVLGAFRSWLERRAAGAPEALLEMLGDRTPAAPAPARGTARAASAAVGTRDAALARALSAPFVLHPEFGTRCSTVVLLPHTGAGVIRERRFDAQGVATGDTELEVDS
jgi:uncharacterized protein with NRDE domain